MIGIALLGIAVWRSMPWLGISSLLLGFLGLFGLLVAPAVGIPAGLAERLAGYPGVVWMIVLGVILLLSAARIERSSTSVSSPAC